MELKKRRITLKSKTDVLLDDHWTSQRKSASYPVTEGLCFFNQWNEKIILFFLVMWLLKVISHVYDQGKDTLL